MSKTYSVQPGGFMETIAEKFGFRDYHIIYDDANNAHLKTSRPNPHILFPGDSVFIPDMDPGHEPAVTDKKHKFEIKAQKIKLILYIRRNGQPWAKQPYKLKIGDKVLSGKTGADGLIEQPIPIGEPLGELTFTGPPHYTRQLNFGFLNPITKISGRQMRLNNLCFWCGPHNGAESDSYDAAVRAFQLKSQLTVTGKFNAQTLDKLQAEYDHGIPS